MARRKENLPQENDPKNLFSVFNTDGFDVQKSLAFCLFLFSVFLTFSLFGMGGMWGDSLFTLLAGFFGIFAYGVPIGFFVWSYLLFKKELYRFLHVEFLGIKVLAIILFSLFGFIKISDQSLSGKLGEIISSWLSGHIGFVPSVLILIFSFLILLSLYFKIEFEQIFSRGEKDLESLESENSKINFDENNKENILPVNKFSMFSFLNKIFGKKVLAKREENFLEDSEETTPENTESKDIHDELFGAVSVKLSKDEKQKIKVSKNVSEEEIYEAELSAKTKNKKEEQYTLTQYERPPLNLYEEDTGKPSAGDNKENARLIKRTMQNFGISVEMEEVSVGPTVTRYCLKPAQGVKLSKIATLDKNLAMELSTTSVRIEAPIPGRSVVGIEIPNRTKSTIGIGTLFESPQFQEDKTPLLLAIGKDISGNPIFANLAKIPHLLIAGTTGSGKSVMIHTLIQSLIYRNSPADLKFIMIDPKKVELAFYNKLPHLYTNVIKEPKKAVQTLNWLVHEMERRYEVLEENGKQNIAGYHAVINEKYKRASQSKRPVMEELPEKMPYIVVVIDELADFMMAFPKEMESGIVRLAQKSRAVGIHLILSTQKPLATIISSVIKANVPGRIALKVSSRMDSMVILDQIGAEKLLGNGDLLFVNSDGSDSKRIQSPFVSDKEVVRVVDFLKNKYTEYTTEELILPSAMGGGNVAGSYSLESSGEKDDRYEEAKEIILQTKNTSVTHLQRKMGIGYSRAAKLVDMLEANGVLGPQNGSKPREILISSNNSASNSVLEDEADKMLQNSGMDDDIDLNEKRIF